jgi:hypothetical protein
MAHGIACIVGNGFVINGRSEHFCERLRLFECVLFSQLTAGDDYRRAALDNSPDNVVQIVVRGTSMG